MAYFGPVHTIFSSFSVNVLMNYVVSRNYFGSVCLYVCLSAQSLKNTTGRKLMKLCRNMSHTGVVESW